MTAGVALIDELVWTGRIIPGAKISPIAQPDCASTLHSGACQAIGRAHCAAARAELRDIARASHTPALQGGGGEHTRRSTAGTWLPVLRAQVTLLAALNDAVAAGNWRRIARVSQPIPVAVLLRRVVDQRAVILVGAPPIAIDVVRGIERAQVARVSQGVAVSVRLRWIPSQWTVVEQIVPAV